MLVKKLYLRNYRVYEDELELELPSGLVGIYGPNGSGKSYLCESLLFALWGKTRTAVADVRTTGVGGDCVVEVQFEHEGHLYGVRRTVAGVNATVKASAFADGQQVAEGVRDTSRYVHSILGMDDAAFRASVFAEQKQLALFSQQRPQQRRDLVLRLLGVMPLDTARDEARRDARLARERLESVQNLLPDVDALRAEAAEVVAAAEAAGAEAVAEAEAARVAGARAAGAGDRLESLEEVRRRHDEVVRDGQAARVAHDQAAQRLRQLDDERALLTDAETRLAEVAAPAAGLADAEAQLEQVRAVAAAAAGAARARAVPEAVAPPDDDGAEAVRVEAEAAAAALAAVDGELAGAKAELDRARVAAGRSAALSCEGDCPLCGQALGDAFEQVQAHRAGDVDEAEARVAALDGRRRAQAEVAAGARTRATQAAAAVKEARRAWAAFEQASARRAEAEAALAEAEAVWGRPFDAAALDAVTAGVEQRRAAAQEAARLRGLLERAPALAARHASATVELAGAVALLEQLREQRRSLAFDPDALAAARDARDAAVGAADAAAKTAADCRVEAEKLQVKADEAARRLAEAERQHASVAGLVEETRHLGRLADLLGAFRNSVVATVGPRLASHAADLFAELTDHEYDRLELDAESYEIQIRDRGRLHGMARFSGSETDLANLALRVAISEHVRLLSGGTVGLLVLDEVFGPLDEDRKARMLSALERLKGRFRQVLVVTHDDAIKSELPSAIEVVKLPGRRATARLVNA